jgi:hypothetical protein
MASQIGSSVSNSERERRLELPLIAEWQAATRLPAVVSIFPCNDHHIKSAPSFSLLHSSSTK